MNIQLQIVADDANVNYKHPHIPEPSGFSDSLKLMKLSKLDAVEWVAVNKNKYDSKLYIKTIQSHGFVQCQELMMMIINEGNAPKEIVDIGDEILELCWD